MRRVPCRPCLFSWLALSLVLGADAPAQTQQTARAGGTFYVSAAAGVAGDGSRHAPFHSLSEAEASSQPGDTIYVLGNATGKTLDGGIALKPRQKLIGLGVDGAPPQRPRDRPRLTNSASLPGGIIVRLSEHNEVAGIHFTGMRNAAIAGDGATYSGTFIHHATFTGHADEHIEPRLLRPDPAPQPGRDHHSGFDGGQHRPRQPQLGQHHFLSDGPVGTGDAHPQLPVQQHEPGG